MCGCPHVGLGGVLVYPVLVDDYWDSYCVGVFLGGHSSPLFSFKGVVVIN